MGGVDAPIALTWSKGEGKMGLMAQLLSPLTAVSVTTSEIKVSRERDRSCDVTYLITWFLVKSKIIESYMLYSESYTRRIRSLIQV